MEETMHEMEHALEKVALGCGVAQQSQALTHGQRTDVSEGGQLDALAPRDGL